MSSHDVIKCMAYDYGYSDCASTCCSEQSSYSDQAVQTIPSAYPLHKLCQVLSIKIEEMGTAVKTLDHDCAVRDKLLNCIADITMVQDALEDHL